MAAIDNFKVIFHVKGSSDTGPQISLEHFQGPDPFLLMEENGWDNIAGGLAKMYIREGVFSSTTTYSVLCLDTAQISVKNRQLKSYSKE